jgi:hypothetical protein
MVLCVQVEHFEKWAQDAKVKVMRPNTMNNYGAVLDDIGMENMLNELMTRYLNPMAAGASLSCLFAALYFEPLVCLLLFSIPFCGVWILGFLLPYLKVTFSCQSAVLFPNVGGSSLDSHHGFVVEYAMDRDLDLGGCHNPCTLRIACPTGSLLPPPAPPPSFTYLDGCVSDLPC